MSSALDEFFTHFPHKISNVLSDSGSEYLAKVTGEVFKKHGINHITTRNQTKAQVTERVTYTSKEKVVKRLSDLGSHEWQDVIDDVVKLYNDSEHSSIGTSPNNVNKKSTLWE